MARSVSGTISSAVILPVTEPGYLVYLGFPTILRYSTRDTVSFDGNSWTGGLGVSVPSVTGASATIELSNADLSASALVLNNSLSDIVCRVYQLYNGDAEPLFTGFLDSASVGNRVTLNATAFATAKKVPNKYITYPTFNWLIAPGTKLTWANTYVTLPSAKSSRKRG